MKKTRKSLFFSTLAMVALLIVAISTATFAWYSAQSNVAATGAALTTANATDANIGLYFGAEAPTAAGASTSAVVFGTKNDIAPMIPKTDPSATTDGALAFNSATIAGGIFKNDVTEPTPWTPTNVGNTASEFGLVNFDLVKTNYVIVTPTIVPVPAEFADNAPSTDKDEATQTALLGEIDNALRIAVYVENSDGTGVKPGYTYLGTWAPTGQAGKAKYGSIAEAQAAAAAEDDDYGKVPAGTFGNSITKVGNSLETFNAYGQTGIQIKIYAWLEGSAITAVHSLATIGFGISFAAAKPGTPPTP